MTSTTATILVTDLVASTELRVSLGEERAEELRHAHDSLLSGALDRHGGRHVKGLGDGIMATFDGAGEAVSAAVAMQQAIDAHAKRISTRLQIRIGISSGDVTLEDGDCFGTPVVEASRLCAEADGGQILVAELVRLLARGRGGHEFVQLGDLELKGLPDPVPACAVRWAPLSGDVTSGLVLPSMLAPSEAQIDLTGRDIELAAVLGALAEARGGKRRVVLLSGEPGIGKTRLAAEVARRAHQEGTIVLYGRCDEDMGVSFQPFVEALAYFALRSDPAALHERLGRFPGELVRLAPELAESIPDLEPPLKSDAETERYRLFDAVASWLEALSSDAGAVIVVDDLHWAEKPTLLLLRHIIRSSDAARLLVIGTYRDTDLDRRHPLAEMLADLRREPGVERVGLTGLDVEGVLGMMASAAAGDPLDERADDLARAIWAETEGNPFFVHEILRSLVESGAVYQRDGKWTSDLEVDELRIPEGVREVVGRRLSRLSDDANTALGAAAVVGTEFDLAALAAVCGMSEDALIDAVDEAVVANLVREADVGLYRFAHAIVRTTLYEELSVTRRARRHEQVARLLEDRGSDHATLAYHWSRAGGGGMDAIAKAAEYSAAAGDDAMETLAPDQATRFYRQSLELLDDLGVGETEQRCDLLIRFGVAQRDAGDAAYRETLLQAAGMALRLGDHVRLAGAAAENSRGYASFIGLADRERIEVLETAYAALGPQHAALRAWVCATLAGELIFADDPVRRFALADEAIEIARAAGDDRALAEVLVRVTPALHVPSHMERGEALVEELHALAQRVGDPSITAFSHLWSWINSMLRGDPVAMSRHLGEAERLANDLNRPALKGLTIVLRAAEAAFRGDLRAVEDLAARAFEVNQHAGMPDASEWYFSQTWFVRMHQDRADEVTELQAAYGERYVAAPAWFAGLVWSLLGLGRIDDAAAIADTLSHDDFAGIPYDYFWLFCMSVVGVTYARAGRPDDCRAVYERLKDYGDQTASVVIVPAFSVHLALGMAAHCFGDHAASDDHFARGLEVHERFGPYFAAHMRLEWGRCLAARGDGRAREMLEEAANVGEEYGDELTSRQARELLERS